VIITVSVAGARVPTFGTPSATADGFTVQITNYDAAYTWAGTATTGSVAIDSSTGVVTVTGVAPGTSSTVTVSTTRTGYTNGSASVSATSTMGGAALVPTFGTPSATTGGFTVAITNFDAAYTWTGTATTGSVAIDSSTGVVTVTGVAPGTSSTATVNTTRTGYTNGSASVSATSTPAAVICTTTSGGSTPIACAVSTTSVRVYGPGGGQVFYDAGSVQSWGRYMEAAAADLTNIAWTTNAPTCYAAGASTAGSSTDVQNCQTNNLYPGTPGAQTASTNAAVAIGMGAANTDAIIARMNAGGVATNAYAAGLARGYTNNGFTDWFLPSQDELNQLYLQKTVVGGFAADNFWSSSQSAANNAWLQDFVDGIQYNGFKNYALYVRPVRAF
jgi:hypothetical protein